MAKIRSIVFILCFISTVSSAYSDNLDVTKISNTTSGGNSNGASSEVSCSGDGSLVAFSSMATNLVSSDTNTDKDIFVRNRATSTTSRASLTAAGAQVSGNSETAVISADGTVVAFASDSTGLVSSDSNNSSGDGVFDIFVKVLGSGAISRVSVSTAAVQSNGSSQNPSVSGDGRYVTFESVATNLISSDTNSAKDVFLHDRNSSTTSRISTSYSAGSPDGASSSAVVCKDGTYVAFVSAATDLVVGDTNTFDDIFRYTIGAGTIIRVSIRGSTDANGSSSSPSISGDGRYIAFSSEASNLISSDTNDKKDVFLFDANDSSVRRISEDSTGTQSNGDSIRPVISPDGTSVLFLSDATNLVTGDTNNSAGDGNYDLFRYTISSASVARFNITAASSETEGKIDDACSSNTGDVVAFSSDASDVVPNDSNSASDVFVRDSNCVSDSDGDATNDCTDVCLYDATKTSAGTCGCGVADSDSDGDLSLDCQESCDSDATKTTAGTCGCGVSDSDTNGNGVSDCLDPTSLTIPLSPAVQTVRGITTISIEKKYSAVTYVVKIFQGEKLITQKSSKKRKFRFGKLAAGRYSTRYLIILGDTKTKLSPRANFKIRGSR